MSRALVVLVILLAVLVAWVPNQSATHLGVPSRQILSLVSYAGATPGPLYYDTQGPASTAFTVPTGWSFVVTDVTLVTYFVPSTQTIQWTISSGPNISSSRFYLGQMKGSGVSTVTLNAGVVMPSGSTPTVSVGSIFIPPPSDMASRINVLGYLVEGDGLQSGQIPNL